MPALNFQKQWAEAVRIGARLANGEPVAFDGLPKRTTIRRPNRAKPGQTLYLFTGQRTPQCERLGNTLCLFVTPTIIFAEGIKLAGQRLTDTQVETLAQLDTAGQLGAEEFLLFFKECYGLPFVSELIGW